MTSWPPARAFPPDDEAGLPTDLWLTFDEPAGGHRLQHRPGHQGRLRAVLPTEGRRVPKAVWEDPPAVNTRGAMAIAGRDRIRWPPGREGAHNADYALL
jgi:hypothetical protein